MRPDKQYQRKRMARGQGGTIAQHSVSDTIHSQPGETIPPEQVERAPKREGDAVPGIESPPVIVDVNPDVDLARNQTYARPSQKRLARLIRSIKRLWRNRRELPSVLRSALRAAYGQRPWREKTPDEQYAIEERKRRQMEKKTYLLDACRWWETISNTLARMGYRHLPRGEGSRAEHKVGFDMVLLQPEAIYYRIDTEHLPYGVSSFDLVKDDRVVSELLISLRRRVQAKWRDNIGAWIIVERSIGLHGIPSRVPFSAMLENIPKTVGTLSVPMGITTNSRMVYQDISDMPHALVAGTTGGGKSTLINVWLVTLLHRNTPTDLDLILVDLKGGVEFSHYQGVPHLGVDGWDDDDGVVTEISQIVPMLVSVVKIMHARAQMIRQAGYSDIVDYNVRSKRREKLSRIVIVMDELAAMMLPDLETGKSVKSDAMKYIAHIGNQGRAFGVHLVGATQQPDSTVISSSIKSIMNTKCAFYCSTGTASQTILGNWRAFQDLNKHPGRYIYHSGAEVLEIQGPWLSPTHRNEFISAIKRGDTEYKPESNHDVTKDEILQWALISNNGYLPMRRIYDKYAHRGLPRAELEEWLKEMEGERFRILNDWYEVSPSQGNRPRVLTRLETQ